jgi:DNA-binding NtrC family response regulator
MEAAPAMSVLVIEDDANLLEAVCDHLRDAGHVVVAARSLADAYRELGAAEFDVALVDLVLPDGSGLDVLRRIMEEELATEAILLTGHASVETAIEAMKRGAYDYVTKPASFQEIDVTLEKAREKSRLRRENASLRTRLQRQEGGYGLVTADPAMKELMATVARVAPSELSVLIQGESGTGKELVARAIHAASPRARFPFVAVNCAAMAESLLESELFGHERGAFTGAVSRAPGLFEVADRGVLFLDEVGEITPAVQVKLLRAVETREIRRVGSSRSVRVDVRIVSATNKDVKAEAQAGRFREDLYYRLNGITIRLPPLRERPGDVPLLARHFLDRFGPRKQLTPRALEVLSRYAWPGNVRELQMVVQRAALLASGDTIDAESLALDARDPGPAPPASPAGRTLAEVVRD